MTARERCLLAALLLTIGYAIGATVTAQVRVNDQTSGSGGGNQVTGITSTSELITIGRPTVFRMLTPPQEEPTAVGKSGSFWAYCSGPNDAFHCEIKFNVNGTVLTLMSKTWALQ